MNPAVNCGVLSTVHNQKRWRRLVFSLCSEFLYNGTEISGNLPSSVCHPFLHDRSPRFSTQPFQSRRATYWPLNLFPFLVHFFPLVSQRLPSTHNQVPVPIFSVLAFILSYAAAHGLVTEVTIEGNIFKGNVPNGASNPSTIRQVSIHHPSMVP
jgi:hypothetical protein